MKNKINPSIPKHARTLHDGDVLQLGDLWYDDVEEKWKPTMCWGLSLINVSDGEYIRPLPELDKPADIPRMTLPTDSAERKEVPVFRGALRYFPAAIAGVASISKKGNDKHNPGEEMHHARGKSSDQGDCILRHLIDVEDLRKRGAPAADILHEVNQMAWRALAFSQELHEQIGSAPLAPGAKLP